MAVEPNFLLDDLLAETSLVDFDDDFDLLASTSDRTVG
jgi:hypothetical protein